ncbi:mersacidin/lichenicidin family type 2 lantibiotic [Thermosporothrix hazakensis]|uniref:Mersacidin/lichenicidin family type 2 lantibiotic n=2 Tax=Thermosporothrix TaxID=768650 RepID=A0A326U6J7_THEHA|nr:mersacidin/lichenicidin family type 2 lantibiotic [Thermosporothrix hazakensis]PZW29571.1 mersacidin/lichenicidin family type 2 lantibiotic [Thermosporothrix hazakensis]BBH85858.1 hypothetical protein KTC_06090 [Thermosporothrix sp. COM3]GCE45715.1 hypothetical protein KTH_05840 [Thermosporothrix hazakensis]
MKHEIIRAWKDASYRKSLSVEELETLPENPAGIIELSDAELKAIQGGHDYDDDHHHHHHHRHHRHSSSFFSNTEINTVAVICLQSALLLNICITMGTDCVN